MTDSERKPEEGRSEPQEPQQAGPERPEEGQQPVAAQPEGAPGTAWAEAAWAEVEGPKATEAAPPPAEEKPNKRSELREWVETIIIAILVALVIKTFVVQLYVVDGPSMEPTLYTADRLLVNKFIYRFRSPAPGEIVVLQDPTRPARELIKRVVAVEGETIEVRKGVVYVNGKPLEEPFTNPVVLRREDMAPQTVPPKHIFVMGDNRSWSQDSRAIGPIPLGKVDGKAFFMFWPTSKFGKGPLDQPRSFAAGAGTSK